ncbi:MAG TPA: DUF192 domain-containing protein [Terriglobales bacterium]|nr:DUF192 domain-containing protein [Terriglobales bacterium]
MIASTRSPAYAFNRTRHAYLATRLAVAGTHWSRFRGLMCTEASSFQAGDGLWIVPCRGVHTFAMNFPIDVVYLDSDKFVVHLEENLKPWRLARIKMRAASVIELPGETLKQSGTTVGDKIEIAVDQGTGKSTA